MPQASGAVIIEAAINGGASKDRNPNVPQSPDEIAFDALACFDAGAAIVHSHIENMRLGGQAAADRYCRGWRDVLAARPDALLYPTIVFDESGDCLSHVPALAKRGYIRMASFDPGSTNLAAPDENDMPLPGGGITYINSYDSIESAFAMMRAQGVSPSLAIYEPSFLRATLAYHRGGRLPAGSFVKLYFGGDYNLLTGAKSKLTFGLPPTKKALEAYLEMLEGSGLPWAVAVLGGDVIESGLAKLAIERGGHIRVGLEDYMGEATPSNVELIEAAKSLCKQVGRRVASIEETCHILGCRRSR